MESEASNSRLASNEFQLTYNSLSQLCIENKIDKIKIFRGNY